MEKCIPIFMENVTAVTIVNQTVVDKRWPHERVAESCQGQTQGGIKGFIPQNCRSLYHKETSFLLTSWAKIML